MTDEEITAEFERECNRTKVAFDWLSFARRIAEAEREVCAKVCEGESAKWRAVYEANIAYALVEVAAAIRARGEK